MASSSSSSPDLTPAPYPSQTPDSPKYTTFEEVLEDLSSRFILNLPDDELESLERVCFQVEQAHWYYEDFIRDVNPKLPSLPLKRFSEMLFQACPLLHRWSGNHEGAFDHFMKYKTRVPVCGAIMLNETWDKVILVKGWKQSSGWGFPKGKINQSEPPHACAVREVLEETGYNLADQIDPDDVIEVSIREQLISLYIVPGVPESFEFQTRTRKEISKIDWFKLIDLPTWKRNKPVPGKFYLIGPFIAPLKTYIHERKPRKMGRKAAKTPNVRVDQSLHMHATNGAAVVDYKSHSALSLDPGLQQESSSQSSSADNGDPQTPSPLYTEAVVNHTSDVPAEDVVASALKSESIDPQLARLLSALTNSAKGDIENPSKHLSDPAILSIGKAEVQTPEKTPVPPVNAMDARSSVHTPSQSAESRHVPSRPPTSLSRSPVQAIRASPTPSRPFSKASMRSPKPAPLNGLAHRTSSPALQATSPPPSATLSTTTSTSSASRPMARRGSSATTDLTPYTNRPPEGPSLISGKRMKQLGLLESLLDETARATPILANHSPALSRPAHEIDAHSPSFYPPFPSHHFQPPMPPMSVPPPSNFNNLSSMYPNNQGPSYPVPNSSIHLLGSREDDAFTVRPRTSNAFHPIPMSHHQPQPSRPIPNMNRASMSQAQLMGVLSGPPAPMPGPQYHHPSGPHGLPMQPSPAGMGMRPPLFMNGPPPSSRMGTVPPQLHVLPPNVMPGPPPPPGPTSAPALSPNFQNPHNPVNQSNAGMLLSLLMNKGTPGGQ